MLKRSLIKNESSSTRNRKMKRENQIPDLLFEYKDLNIILQECCKCEFISSPSVLNISISEINMKINSNKNIETVLYCHHLSYFIVYSYFEMGCIQGTFTLSRNLKETNRQQE